MLSCNGETGTFVSPNSALKKIDHDVKTIIVEPHPWTVKSASYLSLTREEKADIIWNKIIEDDTLAPPVDREEFFNIDLG